jgi:hypothetical protein
VSQQRDRLIADHLEWAEKEVERRRERYGREVESRLERLDQQLQAATEAAVAQEKARLEEEVRTRPSSSSSITITTP